MDRSRGGAVWSVWGLLRLIPITDGMIIYLSTKLNNNNDYRRFSKNSTRYFWRREFRRQIFRDNMGKFVKLWLILTKLENLMLAKGVCVIQVKRSFAALDWYWYRNVVHARSWRRNDFHTSSMRRTRHYLLNARCWRLCSCQGRDRPGPTNRSFWGLIGCLESLKEIYSKQYWIYLATDTDLPGHSAAISVVHVDSFTWRATKLETFDETGVHGNHNFENELLEVTFKFFNKIIIY